MSDFYKQIPTDLSHKHIYQTVYSKLRETTGNKLIVELNVELCKSTLYLKTIFPNEYTIISINDSKKDFSEFNEIIKKRGGTLTKAINNISQLSNQNINYNESEYLSPINLIKNNSVDCLIFNYDSVYSSNFKSIIKQWLPKLSNNSFICGNKFNNVKDDLIDLFNITHLKDVYRQPNEWVVSNFTLSINNVPNEVITVNPKYKKKKK